MAASGISVVSACGAEAQGVGEAAFVLPGPQWQPDRG